MRTGERPVSKQESIPQQNFQISDEELKALNLDPKEAEELKQFFDALNNLTPAQKQELEDLGRATEERMRQQNLDPNNMDDLMKFLETQSPSQEKSKEQKKSRKEEKILPARPIPAPSLPQEERPEIIAVTSPTDTLTMINEISHYISSLQQKAITLPAMVKKLDSKGQEIAEFKVYLGMLSAPDLIKLLSSKDFVPLQSSLERLHKSLRTFEPSISAKKRMEIVHFDDPYALLDLPYDTTDEEIKARYENLKAHQSPEVIEKQLQEEGCEEKVCKNKIKSAQRAFELIQNAYKSLTENREATDEYLSARISREARKEAASMRAFDSLFASITVAFSSEKLLQQIHQLFEKHKPEELAKMKSQIELEKKVYERSKKRISIPQVRPSQKPQGSPYEGFYKKVGQQQRPPAGFKPGRGAEMPSGKSPQQEKSAKDKAGGVGIASKDGKKEEGKKKEDGKKDSTRETKAKKEEPQKSGEPTKEDIEKLAEIGSVGKLFENAKAVKEIEVSLKPRAGGEPVITNQKLPQIMSRLEAELISDDTGNQEAAKHLKEYFTKIDLESIEKSLKKASPGKGKKLSGTHATYWADNVAKYKDLVEDWYKTVSQPLNIIERHNNKQRFPTALKEAKIMQHGIQLEDIDPWIKFKSGEKPPVRDIGVGNVDLGKIRSSINAIRSYINNDTRTN